MSRESSTSDPTPTFHTPRGGQLLQSFGCILAGSGFIFAMIGLVLLLALVAVWPGNWANAAVLAVLAYFALVMSGCSLARRWRRRFWWTITLEEGHVRLERAAQQARVAYDDVELIEAVSTLALIRLQLSPAPPRTPTMKRRSNPTLPMILHTHEGRRYQITLLVSDIGACYPALISRCPRAGGIGLDGGEHLPSVPEAAAAALRKMAQVRRRAGRLGLWFSTGPLMLGAASLVVLLVGGVGAMQRAEAWLGLFALPPGIVVVLSCRRLLQRATMLLRAAEYVEQTGLPPSDRQLE